MHLNIITSLPSAVIGSLVNVLSRYIVKFLCVQEVLVDSADKVPTGVCPSAPDEAHHAMILTLSSKMGKL
jgi:hypothetical protein